MLKIGIAVLLLIFSAAFVASYLPQNSPDAEEPQSSAQGASPSSRMSESIPSMDQKLDTASASINITPPASQLKNRNMSGMQEFQEHQLRLEKLKGDVYSRPDLFFDKAQRGASGITVAAYNAIASGDPKWVDYLGRQNIDPIKAKLKSLEWVDKAAMNGDLTAKLTFGMQASSALRYLQPTADERAWIERQAFVHLFDLFELNLPDVATVLAGALLDGSLGKQNVSLAYAVMQAGIKRDAASIPQHFVEVIESRATLADKQEAARLLQGGVAGLKAKTLG